MLLFIMKNKIIFLPNISKEEAKKELFKLEKELEELNRAREDVCRVGEKEAEEYISTMQKLFKLPNWTLSEKEKETKEDIGGKYRELTESLIKVLGSIQERIQEIEYISKPMLYDIINK